jgi:CrcB protein
MLTRLLLVGVGGFLGSVMRYLLGSWVQTMFGGRFPLGTLTVNVIGCFGIGLLMGVAEFRSALSAEVRLFAIVGVLGGFTTFSTFSYDTVELGRAVSSFSALLNVGASLALGLTATWLGLALARMATA